MNVLHINQSDLFGGAAIAAYRLHEGLLRQGADSKLLVGRVVTSSRHVAPVIRWNLLEAGLSLVTSFLGLNYLNHLSTFVVPSHPFFKKAQILNLHNLHTGYFCYLAIPRLAKAKPTVLTLHDMWSFTGHCAYSFDCDRWKTGCGRCPHPDTYPVVQRDNTLIEWKLKRWAYGHSRLVIVTDSRWLAEQAKESILNCFPIHHIPYGIDTEAYRPLDPEACRSILGIPCRKKVLMFGAHNLQDPRKGGNLLLKALSRFPESLKKEIVLLTIGESGEFIAEQTGMTTLYLGYLTSDQLKSIAYSASDLFLLPSLAEAFGLVAQEAMSCGIPTVAFDVGGIPDVVRPGVTGYLARTGDDGDFYKGIQRLLDDERLRTRMGQQCREIALKEYPLELQAERYLAIYRRLLEKKEVGPEDV